jgi:hypothetical protein
MAATRRWHHQSSLLRSQRPPACFVLGRCQCRCYSCFAFSDAVRLSECQLNARLCWVLLGFGGILLGFVKEGRERVKGGWNAEVEAVRCSVPYGEGGI